MDPDLLFLVTSLAKFHGCLPFFPFEQRREGRSTIPSSQEDGEGRWRSLHNVIVCNWTRPAEPQLE